MDTDTHTQLIRHLKLYGDRNSSMLAAYPNFKSFHPSSQMDGQIRYTESGKWWIGATEPLAASENRVKLVEAFAENAADHGKRAMIVPVSESLSSLLCAKGFIRTQVGSEAVFDLDQYFSNGNRDPLERFQHATHLLKKGAVVREIQLSEITSTMKAQLDELLSRWIKTRRTVPLHFLNQVDPWQYAQLKKFFTVEFKGEIQAFLAASPIFPRSGFFYADYIRDPKAKPGSIELLLIESMRRLHGQGFEEVSFGLCPLAHLNAKYFENKWDRFWLRLMTFFFSKTTFPFSFKSIFEFKSKLKPTRWEPLFLVTQRKSRLNVLLTLARAHFRDSLFLATVKWITPRLNAALLPKYALNHVPSTLLTFCQKVRITLAFAFLFTVLHLLKPLYPSFFYDSAFVGSQPTVQGWLVGPLFHNNHFHFFGDVVAFVLLGAPVEFLLGPLAFLVVTSLGLWASNPVTCLALYYPLNIWVPEGLLRLLTERDYGSSNAVYAYVGALALVLRSPKWLLTPFLLNAVFLLFARQSWLSFHHLFAMAMGYMSARSFLSKRFNNRSHQSLR